MVQTGKGVSLKGKKKKKTLDKALDSLSQVFGGPDDVGDILLRHLTHRFELWEKKLPLAMAINEASVIDSGNKYVRVTELVKANGCPRYVYYCYHRLLPEEPISPELQRIFDNGKMVHYRWQAYLLCLPQDWKVEIAKRFQKSIVTGEADAIVEHKDFGRWVVEIKSINTFSFKKLEEAVDWHLEQAGIYAWLSSADGMIFIYEDKNNQNVKVFTVHKDWREVKDKYLPLLQDVIVATEEGKVPMRKEDCGHEICDYILQPKEGA